MILALSAAATVPIHPVIDMLPQPGHGVLYWGEFADDHLWLGGSGIRWKTTRSGKVVAAWEARDWSAPAGDDLWDSARDDNDLVHYMTPYPQHTIKAEPGDGPFFTETYGCDRKKLRLGSDPVVARCHSNKEVVCLADGKLWTLSKGKAHRIADAFPRSKDNLLNALSPDHLIIAQRVDTPDGNSWNTHVTTVAGTTRRSTTIKECWPETALCATHKWSFVRTHRASLGNFIDIYRIQNSTGHSQRIAQLSRPYRDSLAWDEVKQCLYVNYEGEDHSDHIEAMSPEGKILWKSAPIVEAITAITVDQKLGKIYCITKAGPISVLNR